MELNHSTALRVRNVRLIGIAAAVAPEAVLEAGDDGRITYAGPAGGGVIRKCTPPIPMRRC